MKLTLQEIVTQINGAQALDAFRWTALNMTRALVDQYSFDDNGATYISSVPQEPDWGEWARKQAGYYEPREWVLQ